MYQNNASDFVRQFQDNMLRKQANFPLVVRTVNQIAKAGPVIPRVRPVIPRAPMVRPYVHMSLPKAPTKLNWLNKYGGPTIVAIAAGAYGNGLYRQGAANERERIKQMLYSYAPYVGGGALLGALGGGYIGHSNNQTLAGGLLGGLVGAGLGAAGKYAYDKYKARA